jgi:hypothetical protein
MALHLARLHVVALAAALFFVVWGAKLAVIDRFGSDLPVWDQWDAEGEQIFLPYFQHRLGFRDFFAPHNEHRIACTRALALGLLLLNGQWDARLECVVSAALHAALAAAIFLYGCALLGRHWILPWLVSVAALTAPPVAWQNVLSGFHSQQYFLIGFSLAALALLLTAPPWTTRWWGGLGCAVLALFSMASGLLAAAAVVFVLAVSHRPGTAWRPRFITIAACVAVVAAGWMLKVDISQNAPLRAHSPADFGLAFWRSLHWPAVSFAPLALLLWLPWAWLGWQIRRGPDPANPRRRVVFAAGLWILLQFAATAYGRGAGGGWPAPRYLDTVAVGLLVNALALAHLAPPAAVTGGRKWLRLAVVAGWFGVVGLGLWRHVAQVFEVELPAIAVQMREAELDTRAYLATGDAGNLDHAIPYPTKSTLIARLDHPEIRAVLPASIRPPVALAGQAEPAGSFAARAVAPATPAPAATAYWGSYTARGFAAQGVWRSAPLSAGPQAGYWRLEVAGDLGRLPGLALRLVASPSGATLATIAPPPGPRAGWRTVYVPAPRQAVRLVARDDSPSGWLGFSAPVEMASLSYWVMRLAPLGSSLAILAGVAAVLFAALFGWRPNPGR